MSEDVTLTTRVYRNGEFIAAFVQFDDARAYGRAMYERDGRTTWRIIGPGGTYLIGERLKT